MRNSLAREFAIEARRKPLRLTPKQMQVLAQAARPVTDRMAAEGFPGWPEYSMDRRSLTALERRGLVRCQMRDGNLLPLCFVLTESGREMLRASPPHP